MDKLNFRPLKANEIEVRIDRINKNGAFLLLYQDARCAMEILDETVGATNWQRIHSRDNANCTILIWDERKNTWVGKEDTGVESNTEAQKGLASDSFKRAAVNWGIGRELYTSPDIWVKAEHMNLYENNGKYKCYDKFVVEKIQYTDGCITGLSIVNKTMSEKSGKLVRVFLLTPKEKTA